MHQTSFPSCSFSRSHSPCTLLGCSWNKNSLLPVILWTGFSWAEFFVQDGGWSIKGGEEFIWEISLQVLPPQAKAAVWISVLMSGCSLLAAWMVCQPPQESQFLLLAYQSPAALQSSGMFCANPVFTGDRETPPLDIKLWSYSHHRTTQHSNIIWDVSHLQQSKNQEMRLPQLFRVPLHSEIVTFRRQLIPFVLNTHLRVILVFP